LCGSLAPGVCLPGDNGMAVGVQTSNPRGALMGKTSWPDVVGRSACEGGTIVGFSDGGGHRGVPHVDWLVVAGSLELPRGW